MNRHFDKYLKGAIIAAVLLVLIFCALLIVQYRRVERSYGAARYPTLLHMAHARGPLLPTEANSIQVWMTFDYINHVFLLPPSYLQHTLDITDATYPRLTIAEYAEEAHTDTSSALQKVQTTVREYAHPQ